MNLSNQGAGGGALVSPGRGKDTDGLVVARQTVDAGLDQNKAELGVLVLAVTLEVLADGHRLQVNNIVSQRTNANPTSNWTDMNYLLDQEVQVLGDLRSEAYCISHLSVSR